MTRAAKAGAPAPVAKKSRKRSVADPDRPETVLAGVTITHPERVIYEEANLTKRDLASFYERMAPHILPYIKDRPLSVVRCPRGAGQACFFQKHASARDIQGIEVVKIEDSKGLNPYFVANTTRALVGLAQMGVIELHGWGATMPQIERPDTIIFDLDPDVAVPWASVVDAAHMLRGLLADIGLQSFVKTTGGKGLHVVVPLAARSTWDDVKAFSGAIADRLSAQSPARYIATASKAKRQGKIFIDYLRNSRGATAVTPYSLRARPQAMFAMPLTWVELTHELHPEVYTLAKFPDGFSGRNAWEGYDKVRQGLTQKMKRAVDVT